MLQKITLSKNNCALAGIIAAVAVIGMGAYLLHRKVLKHRLREQARMLSMYYLDRNLSAEYSDYDHDGDEESETDYYDDLFGDFDKDGFYNSRKDLEQGADKE